MTKCQYQYKKSIMPPCTREAHPSSSKGYCILHENWENKDPEETKRAIYEEIKKENPNFTECTLPEIDLSNKTIKGNAIFEEAKIKGNAIFTNTTIEGDALFEYAKIEGDAQFGGVKIEGNAWFRGVKIEGNALFWDAKIEENAQFRGAKIEENAQFGDAKIEGDAQFGGVKIEGNALFWDAKIEENAQFGDAKIGGDAWFRGAKIGGDAQFRGATIERITSFEEVEVEGDAVFSPSNISNFLIDEAAEFKKNSAREEAYRVARRTQEAIGNRRLADDYFYLERVAARKKLRESKKRIERVRGFLELPLQYIFGYGVKPFWVIGWWLAIVFLLAFVYAVGNVVVSAYFPLEYIYFSLLISANPGYQGYIFVFANDIRSLFGWTVNEIEKTLNLLYYLGKCVYFSVTSAATPGYGGYIPRPGFEILATVEAIFGTFMWAAFIATFARKFMRA